MRFLEWQLKEKGGGLLWIRGDPGKGKTMLLCGIIDELSASDNGPLAFFFCQATDSRLDNAAAVLRGLIYMLVDQDPSLISHVRKRYDGTGERLFEGPNAWHALSKIFLDMLKDADSPCLIIDALDECKTGLFELLDFIVEASSSYPQVKWIISSRLLPEIKEYLGILPEKTRLTLEMNESSVSEAVETFIHHRVQKLEKLKRYDQEMSKAVSSHLLKNAHGTFLWVALVCERLAQLPRMRTIEKLTAFPPGLDPLYQRMMQQVQEHEESSLCKEILGILSTTYRPITLDELTTFVKVPECIVDDGHETLEEIIRYCGSFLTVTQSTVFFVHQSAKDFLLDQAKLQILPDGIQDKHRSIFEQSLEVLNKTLQRNILSLEDHTISIDQIRRMDYAPDSLKRTHYMCVSWIDHLRDCGSESTLHKFLQIGGLVDDFLSKRYLYWLEALSLLEMIPRGFQMTSKLEVLSRVSTLY